MPQSLVVTVHFHEGRYHGQDDQFGSANAWPPSPGRLFQAMVAAAAQGASLEEEDVAALSWLERLHPPRVAAPAARLGRPLKLFVPNNDLDSVGGDPNNVGNIRVAKTWRPSFFDGDEPVLYVWDFESGQGHAERICGVAARVYQLGRGVDMAWAYGHVVDRKLANARLDAHCGPIRKPTGIGKTATPTFGTLKSLDIRYGRNRTRFTIERVGRKSKQLVTKPPLALFARTGYNTPSRRLHFELRTPDGAFAPRPLSSASTLVTGLMKEATRRLQAALPDRSKEFERLIVGRGAGPADLAQRIRLVPVPSIGAEHTDLSVRRFFVDVPAACPIRSDDLKWAFAGVRPCDPETGEVWAGSMVSTNDGSMADRYFLDASQFRSVTPIAFSSFPHRPTDAKSADDRIRHQRQAARAVVQALRHVNIRAGPADIRVQREPLHRRGLRSESFAAGSRFAKHALWHVELHFHERVSGPVMIGDGRFQGLGLMEPIATYSDVFSFALGRTRPIRPGDRLQLIRSLRRALMSLARDDTGRVERLFSGHESDGTTARSGHHAHVFLAADRGAGRGRSIGRIIVAAPWAVDRTVRPSQGERRRFEEVTRQLKHLRAGKFGRFHYLVAQPISADDSLVQPARIWKSETPYVGTRHLKKRRDVRTGLPEDAVAECRRRGLPTPRDVEVLDIAVGPRGGRPQRHTHTFLRHRCPRSHPPRTRFTLGRGPLFCPKEHWTDLTPPHVPISNASQFRDILNPSPPYFKPQHVPRLPAELHVHQNHIPSADSAAWLSVIPFHADHPWSERVGSAATLCGRSPESNPGTAAGNGDRHRCLLIPPHADHVFRFMPITLEVSEYRRWRTCCSDVSLPSSPEVPRDEEEESAAEGCPCGRFENCCA